MGFIKRKFGQDPDFYSDGKAKCHCIWKEQHGNNRIRALEKIMDDPSCPKCHPGGAASARRGRNQR